MTNILNQLKNIEIVKHTDWIKTRRSGIGGSEIGTIMGVNKYSSIQNLFDYKTTGKKQEYSEESLEKMHFGTVLEKIVVEEFERRNYVKCIEIEMLRSTEYNFCLANIDRLILEDGKITAILECKTASENSKNDWLSGNIQESYIMQVQWYMYVTGIHKAYIACLCGGNTYIQHEILFNEELCNKLFESAKYFWEENVLKNIRPDITGDKQTTEYIKNKFTDVEDNIISIDEEYDKIIDKLKELKAKEKDLKKEITEIENKIKHEIGNNKGAVTSNYKLSYAQSIKMIADIDRMKQDYIFDEYSKESIYRTLRITKFK